MEKNKFYENFIKPNLPKTKKEWVWFIMIILVVVVLGLVGVNNYLAISYKSTLILSPCNLCETFQENQRLYQINGINLIPINITPVT